MRLVVVGLVGLSLLGSKKCNQDDLCKLDPRFCPTPSSSPSTTPSPIPSNSPTPLPTSTPTPSPTSTPTPIPTPVPSATPSSSPSTLLRMGFSLRGTEGNWLCRLTPSNETKVFLSSTPRVEAFPGDKRGQEQPHNLQDTRGAIGTQSHSPDGPPVDELEHSPCNTSDPSEICIPGTDRHAYNFFTVLTNGIYRAKACPQPDTPLTGTVPPCTEVRFSVQHGVCELK